MIAIMGLVILKKLYVNLKIGNIRIPFSYQRSNHIHSCCFSRFIESAILLHGIFQFDPAFIQLSLCQTNSTVYAAVSTKNYSSINNRKDASFPELFSSPRYFTFRQCRFRYSHKYILTLRISNELTGSQIDREDSDTLHFQPGNCRIAFV